MHFDEHMLGIMQTYGALTYLLVFIIVFCETGLVVTPFLPGDSLLFVIGTLCIAGGFNPWISALVVVAGALAGDNVNYRIGRVLGPVLFKKEKARFFNKDNLIRAHNFYEKHGGKTIIIARFIPILRTFAPFVAGMGRMTFRRYIAFCVLGAVIWVAFYLSVGYFLGMAFKEDVEYVILVFLVATSIPALVALIREKVRRSAKKKAEALVKVRMDVSAGEE
jgi:membrane-associated protein